MKLFTEKFLGGSISFETSVEGGTIFTVALPEAPN
jgi:hypothetical protein